MTNFTAPKHPSDPIGDFQKLVGLAALLLGAGYLGYRYRDKLAAHFRTLVNLLEEKRDEIGNDKYDEMITLARQVERKLLPPQKPAKPKPSKKVVVPVKLAAPAVKAVAQVAKTNAFALNERQEMVYKQIKASKKLTMIEIEENVPGVTNRTLRRDMNKLEKLGLIEKLGKTKDTYYKLRN